MSCTNDLLHPRSSRATLHLAQIMPWESFMKMWNQYLHKDFKPWRVLVCEDDIIQLGKTKSGFGNPGEK